MCLNPTDDAGQLERNRLLGVGGARSYLCLVFGRRNACPARAPRAR
ncbi:hypothetical protein ACUXIW_000565 [Ralstonia pickettii]